MTVTSIVRFLLVAALAAVCLGTSSAFAAPPVSTPEIDPGSIGSVVALLGGALALLEIRR